VFGLVGAAMWLISAENYLGYGLASHRKVRWRPGRGSGIRAGRGLGMRRDPGIRFPLGGAETNFVDASHSVARPWERSFPNASHTASNPPPRPALYQDSITKARKATTRNQKASLFRAVVFRAFVMGFWCAKPARCWTPVAREPTPSYARATLALPMG